MLKHLKRAAIIFAAIVMAVWIPAVLPTSETARALSSCPTDPLSHLTPYNTTVGDNNAINVAKIFKQFTLLTH